MIDDDWTGCYSAGWGDLIIADAYAHPAKYSRALIQRIYQHAREEGWLTAGSTVVDPFGGVALGGFDAAWNGCQWVGVELEPKFVALGNQNIARWEERYAHMPGWGSVRLVQGDSRRLGEVVREASVAVSSPPFAESLSSGTLRWEDALQIARNQNEKWNQGRDGNGVENQARNLMRKVNHDYGSTPGQLGALPATDKGFDAAVGSPPFAGIVATQDPNFLTTGEQGKRNPSKSNQADYGSTAGQLGAMRDRARRFDGVVSSPPYAASFDKYGKADDLTAKGVLRPSAYGNSSGQLASMSDPVNGRDRGSRSEGDFWQAAKEVVAQTYSILRPGAHACWVVKSFVRNKQIVDFPDQWRRLCESVGFRTLHLHRAWLVEVNGHQGRLDGGEADRIGVERKSFFRRLAESKGSPRIDFEVVICQVK